jgi:hypothetical protein
LHCFSFFDGLSELTFESPSKLEWLELIACPRLNSVDIPDSVQMLRGDIALEGDRHFVVNFGRQSCLEHVEMFAIYIRSNADRDNRRAYRAFLRLGELSLKRFRSTLDSDFG